MSERLAEGVRRFRKRPVVIEAIQYRPHDNCSDVAAFMGYEWEDVCDEQEDDSPWAIQTLEGEMWASPGDWIIKGVKGEFYPCKPDIFEATYEAEPLDGGPDAD